ncbi:hypothetical protein V5O48_015084 [Marasmius crinis-equi]|uniref:Uncharacterized protein n=1 Tax=Marasmius crinis-equi TaxID=585013 RepID=A0ABR3EVJ5_9AGAR
MSAPTVLSVWQTKDGIVETAATLVRTFCAPDRIEPHGKPVVFECKLAPMFPDKNSLERLSEDAKVRSRVVLNYRCLGVPHLALEVMVAVVNKSLKSKLPRMTKFEDVQGEFNANLQLLMSPAKDGLQDIHKIFATTDRNFFNFPVPKGPSNDNMTSIMNWISEELITDPDELAGSGLGSPGTIRGLLTMSKRNFDGLTSNQVQNERLVADVGILTYPSAGNERIRLSNVKMHVYVKEVSIAVGAVRRYEVGLRGCYYTQLYEPRQEGMRALKQTAFDNAIEEYETFVSEVHEFVQDTPNTAGIASKEPGLVARGFHQTGRATSIASEVPPRHPHWTGYQPTANYNAIGKKKKSLPPPINSGTMSDNAYRVHDKTVQTKSPVSFSSSTNPFNQPEGLYCESPRERWPSSSQEAGNLARGRSGSIMSTIVGSRRNTRGNSYCSDGPANDKSNTTEIAPSEGMMLATYGGQYDKSRTTDIRHLTGEHRQHASGKFRG